MSERYLSTLRDALTGTALRTPTVHWEDPQLRPRRFSQRLRDRGVGACEFCYTMVGNARLTAVRRLLQQAAAGSVPGDFVEAGTWRGGTSIFARAVQHALGQGMDRRTYVCDSFAGLPESSTEEDRMDWSSHHYLRVPLEQVRGNFRRFHLLDRHVVFVRGVFRHSLPLLRDALKREGRQIAVLYGDGDMFESYYDILYNLYELIAIGGYFLCDDCPVLNPAQQAVKSFRRNNGITERIMHVDGSDTGIFWQKSHDIQANRSRRQYEQWNARRNHDVR